MQECPGARGVSRPACAAAPLRRRCSRALLLAAPAGPSAELIVFEDGRVVKAAGYAAARATSSRSRCRAAAATAWTSSRVERIVDDEVVVDSVVVEDETARRGAPSYDLSYQAGAQAPLRHALRRAHRPRGEEAEHRRVVRLGADPRRVELRAARRLAQGRARPDAAHAGDRAAPVGAQALRPGVQRPRRRALPARARWTASASSPSSCSRPTTRARARWRPTAACRPTARPSPT